MEDYIEGRKLWTSRIQVHQLGVDDWALYVCNKKIKGNFYIPSNYTLQPRAMIAKLSEYPLENNGQKLTKHNIDQLQWLRKGYLNSKIWGSHNGSRRLKIV